MKQVAQNIKTGEIRVDEVPPPNLFKNALLVKNYYSVISAGTEKTSIDMGKMSMFQKAKSRPEDVKKVLKEIRQQGIMATYKKVMNKLDTPKSLGYSTAGVVLAVDEDVDEFKPGDRVACAGAGYALHADIVAVPKNLCVKIPDSVSFEEAAFTTVGAIAMQGLRQANPTLGERVVVIGLGLIGQLTVQMLKANGCFVIGVDLDDKPIENALKISGADIALSGKKQDVKSIVMEITKGFGADAVIITAATSSNDPIKLAGEISRDKGRVILVGDVGLTLPRAPYYMKELDFKLSRSYGPGRYDYNYEEKGNDYPFGYVRWTEKRNMESFLELIQNKKVNVKSITTHTFSIDEAAKAYDLISGEKKEYYIGILLKYSEIEDDGAEKYFQKININESDVRVSEINIGFIGVGSHAQTNLLPHIESAGAHILGVCDSQGMVAKFIAEKYKSNFCTSNADDIFSNEKINTVFVSTRHNSHAEYVIKSLQNDKNIFVEKPLCLKYEELEEITRIYNEKISSGKNINLLVGFNRRFAPLMKKTKEFFSDVVDPIIVNFRVNAGFIPKSHWVQDPDEGGGRIMGEVCHFVDVIQYLSDSYPISVFAQSISSQNSMITDFDNINVTLKMKNGSLGIITYLANGDKGVNKERMEVTGGNLYAILDNFEELSLYKKENKTIIKNKGIDKGWKQEIFEFLDGIKKGKSPIEYNSIRITTLTTLKILESLRTNELVEIK
ncbi:MAG TPA: bi-domain-containing oxidoreductase [Bacteroidota bacterium]|nr:bi-domain-containing oxidoreductase [Bacteroidota bacterium]